jgi:hypothetical protein
MRPSRVTPAERDLLYDIARRCGVNYLIVDIDQDNLVVWTPGTDPAASVHLLSRMFGPLGASLAVEERSVASHAHYMAMLRFTLVDESRRQFAVARWCFKGSIDDWWDLGKGGSLQAMAGKYLPHVNRESFFELM